MPWRSEAMKDVGNCDKPGGGVNHPVIPGFPNGATQCRSRLAVDEHYPF